MEQTQKIEETSIQKNLISIFLLGYATLLFSYFLRLLYGNSLTTQELGVLFSIIGFVTIISFIFSLGLPEAFNYFGVKFFENKNHTNLKQILMYTLTIQTILSAITFLVIFLLSDFLIKNYFKISLEYKPILLIILLSMIMLNLIRTFDRFFITKKNFFLAELFELLPVIAILIPSTILFLKGTATLNNYSILRLVPLIPVLLILPIMIKKQFKTFKKIKLKTDKKLYTRFTKYSLTLAITLLATVLLSKTDILFITLLLNVEKVAFYEIAFVTASIIQAAFLFIPTLLFPYFSSLHNKKKYLQLNQLLIQTYKITLPLILPTLIIFLTFPGIIITTLFKEELFYTKELLQVLSVGLTMLLLQQINFIVLSAINKIKQRNKILITGLIINIILNYILISLLGLIGAAVSTTATAIIMFILSIKALTKNKIKINLSPKYLTKLTIALVILIIILELLTKIINQQNRIELFIVVATSLTMYYIILRIFKILTVKKLVESFNIKIPKKLKWIKKI